VDRVRDIEPPSVDAAGETLEGRLTVTEIEGGSAMNVVPARCAFTVDERTVPGERAALERVAGLEGVEWAVDQDLPPMRCDDDAFADAVLAAATDAQAGEPELVTKPHATDAGWLSQAGTECVIYGPSEPGEAHTDDESVSIDVLERCLETYRRVAKAVAGAVMPSQHLYSIGDILLSIRQAPGTPSASKPVIPSAARA